MDDLEKKDETKNGSTGPRPFPFWLAGLIIGAIVIVVLLQYFATELHDSLLQMDHGVVHFISAGILMATMSVLLAWMFFVSRWNFFFSKLLPIALVLIPIILLVIYKPRWDGNLGIVGLEPRFWSTEKQIEQKNERALLAPVSRDDFPQFLGPNGNGVLPARSYELAKPKLLWKQPIGKAWSGFAAVNGYAVTMEQSDNEELVTCYKVDTGELVWSYRYTARYQDPVNMGGAGPRGTPTIHDGKVYAHGGTGILTCLDGNNGQPIWSVDIPKLLEIKQTEHTTFAGIKYTTEANRLKWGRAASPLVYQDKVIVPGGGSMKEPYTSLIAFDKKNGQEIWRGGDEMISYGSAGLAVLNGRTVITIVNESSVAAHDPDTGEELWKHDRLGNSDSDANCSQAIQVAEDQLVVGKGYGLGGELLQVKNDEVQSVWKNSRVVKTKFTIPVFRDGHIYCLSDGILECTELATGKRVWKKRRFGQGQLLLVGDILIIHSERGTLHFVEATPEGYKELKDMSVSTIDGICWNMLCLVGDRLIVRSELEAACFQLSSDTAQSR